MIEFLLILGGNTSLALKEMYVNNSHEPSDTQLCTHFYIQCETST